MIDVIEKLINDELSRANEKHPRFSSPHEGHAVIKEEMEEAIEEIGKAIEDINLLWNPMIRANYHPSAMQTKSMMLKEHVIEAIKELVQVAAMCEKFKSSL